MSGEIYTKKEGVPALKSGDWAWITSDEGGEPQWLAFGCPCENESCWGGTNYIAVGRKDQGEHSWVWDGDWITPTLSPSIQRRGACEWHGWLVKGKFTLRRGG